MRTGLTPTREVLANGVTVITRKTSTTPAVTLLANLRAGTVHDPRDQEGLAHFVSRTIDRGTERYSADELAEELDSRGVTLAATVIRHSLSLACTCLVEDLDDVMGLLAEIVIRPSFPAGEVERRRGEIVTLIGQDADNPATTAVETLMAMLYAEGHPYGRRLRGTIESLARIDRRSLQQFHAKHFSPGGLSLALVGDIEPARAIEASRAAFGGWTGEKAADVISAPSSSPATRRCRVVPMMNKSQADIAYGFETIARRDPSYQAYSLMNNILGQYSLGGRLGDSIREQQGMAYYVYSAFEANIMPGPLVIRAGVSAANVTRAVASIDAELRKLVDDGPTEQEVAESKQYLIGSMPRTLETNMGIATFLQAAETFDLGLDYDVRVPDLLRAVTANDVHEVARRAIDPDRAAIVVAGPFEGSLS